MVQEPVWHPFSGEGPPIWEVVDHDIEHASELQGVSEVPGKHHGAASVEKPHANPWYRQSFGDFNVTEAPLYRTGRKLRVIGTGAGATGLQAAYKFSKLLKDVDLVLYEKNDGIGGTWLENRYPGCACDIPSHTYQFNWNRNPNWSHL